MNLIELAGLALDELRNKRAEARGLLDTGKRLEAEGIPAAAGKAGRFRQVLNELSDLEGQYTAEIDRRGPDQDGESA